MSEDSYTEVSRQSWFSRIGDAIKGIVIGFILFIAAFPLLFWNEGRAVKRYKTLKEGGGAVISVAAAQVDTTNSGKLVHVIGKADTDTVLADQDFNVSVKAIKLKRQVEMYQWKESVTSKTEKKLGGSTETVNTYSYSKGWAKNLNRSSNFKKPENHQNPDSMPYQSTEHVAEQVQLEAFQLSPSLINKVNNYTPLSLSQKQALPPSLQKTAKINTTQIYLGDDPSSPKVGDVRVKFEVVLPTQVSVIAKQLGSSFEPYISKVGGTLELLQVGSHSADNMIKKEQESNKVLTWVLRGVGLFIMAFGLSMIFKLISVLADVLPILGNILEVGTGLISFLLAGVLSLITIAIAWLFYRPLIGVALIVLAIGLAWLIMSKLKGARLATQE